MTLELPKLMMIAVNLLAKHQVPTDSVFNTIVLIFDIRTLKI